MKNKYIISVIIVVNLSLLLLHIYKNSQLISLSFIKQKNEKMKNELLEQCNTLQQQWYALQDKALIKTFAQQELNMHIMKLQDIQRLAMSQ